MLHRVQKQTMTEGRIERVASGMQEALSRHVYCTSKWSLSEGDDC